MAGQNFCNNKFCVDANGSPNIPAGQSFKINSVALPTTAEVNTLIEKGKRKDGCVVATTENITLSGEQTIDGELTSESRVLVKNQSDQTENGLYVSAAGAWARTADANTGAEILGAAVKILKGTVNAAKEFQNSNSTQPVIGTDDITFADLGTIISHNDTAGLDTGSYLHFNTSAAKTKATQNATGSQDGLLAQADWTTFNSKQATMSASAGVKLVGADIQTDPASDASFNKVTVATVQVVNGLEISAYSAALADEASKALPVGKAGMGWAIIGDDQERVDFSFKADGTIGKFDTSSENVVQTDTDGKFCVLKVTGGVQFKNRLGSELTLRFNISYS